MALGARHATFEGVRYALVEVLPCVAGDSHVAVCESGAGRRSYVEYERWLEAEESAEGFGLPCLGLETAPAAASVASAPASAPATVSAPAAHAAPVTAASPAADKLALFKSLFVGRDDVYAQGYFSKKLQRVCYGPACSLKWKRPTCQLPKVRCSACKNRVYAPLDDAVLLAHFRGAREDFSDVAGVYPLFLDNTVRFLAADFDKDGWEAEARAYMKACADLGASAYLERSRSGNGGHVWLFFDEPVPARAARAFGTRAISLAMERYRALSFTAYDRFFPNQDELGQGGLGNLIALPLQGRAYAQGNSVFIDEGGKPFDDQWLFLSSVRRTPAALVASRAPAKGDDALGGLLREASTDAPWEPAPPLPAGTFPKDPIRVVAADFLYVDTQGFDAAAVNAVRRLAAFANPAFYRAMAARRSVRGVPRVIYAGVDADSYVGLPRGCERPLRS